MSFNDRMLSDADFRDRVEADAVARMNPERSLDGDWADRVANLRAHADAIEAGDRRGAKLLREAATHIAFLATHAAVLEDRVAVAVSGMTRAVGERDHIRRLYCHSQAATMSGTTAQAFARSDGVGLLHEGEDAMTDIVKHDGPDALARSGNALRVAASMGSIITQRYSVELQGKRYVTVAGATLLANGLGYTVREVSVTYMTLGDATGWEAVAEVIDSDGRVIGRGSGICLTSESTWARRPEFARRAMASTRAAGRALRLCLGHLFGMLGDRVQTVTLEEMPE
jgi:hypothetical protein